MEGTVHIMTVTGSPGQASQAHQLEERHMEGTVHLMTVTGSLGQASQVHQLENRKALRVLTARLLVAKDATHNCCSK